MAALPDPSAIACCPPAGSPVVGYRIASMTSRAIAAVMDGIFLATVYTVSGMAALVKTGGLSLSSTKVWTGILAIATLSSLYFWLCEGLFGATLGKAAAGIQVRTVSGRRCGLGPSLVRNLLRGIDALGGYLFGFVVAASSKLKQRLGDQLAGTIVVERKLSRAARIALVVSWIEVFTAGLAGAYWLRNFSTQPVDSPSPAEKPVQVSIRSIPAPVIPFQVLDFRFLENENGPERAATPYRPGSTIWLQYDIAGYATAADGTASLVIQGRTLDENGRPLDRVSTTEFAGHPDPGSTLRGTFHLKLAPNLPAGTYRVDIQVHDRLKNADLEMAPSFQIDAPPPEPMANFELRDLEMSLSRDGPAQETPVLTGAGAVYMRARLFGMQFQGNRVSGRIGLKVIGPDGRAVFDQPNYIDLNATLSYHPAGFWLPVHGFLNVPANLPKGTYVEQYTVVDAIGRREIRRNTAFQVD